MTRIRLVVLALVGALAWALWPDRDSPAALDGGDPALLADRVWLEAMPDSPTRHVHALVVLGDVPYGAFQHGSAYQASIELFEHARVEERLELRFPQTGRRQKVRFAARPCAERPPFDLCLDVSPNPWGGPRRYYGFRDAARAPGAVADLGHRLQHAALARPLAR
jgi:hypothetical protein